MGENKHIEELDAFAKKYVKEVSTNEPSSNFTSNIMEAILAEEKEFAYKNNSNLSNIIWFVLGGFIVASISLLFFGKSSNIELPSFDFVKLPQLNFDVISVSNTTVYAFLFLAVFFFIQGYFMRNYFNKRLE